MLTPGSETLNEMLYLSADIRVRLAKQFVSSNRFLDCQYAQSAMADFENAIDENFKTVEPRHEEEPAQLVAQTARAEEKQFMPTLKTYCRRFGHAYMIVLRAKRRLRAVLAARCAVERPSPLQCAA
jgi:hypothetical protein